MLAAMAVTGLAACAPAARPDASAAPPRALPAITALSAAASLRAQQDAEERERELKEARDQLAGYLQGLDELQLLGFRTSLGILASNEGNPQVQQACSGSPRTWTACVPATSRP